MSAVQFITPFVPPKSASNILRNSLLAMTMLSLLFSIIFSTVGILASIRIKTQLTDLERFALYSHIVVYIMYTIVCSFGVYAIAVKGAKQTSFYMSMVIGQILFSLASGALCLYLLFNNTTTMPWNVAQCLAVAFDSLARDLCKKTPLLKGFATAMFIVMWLVEFATIAFGNSFLSQLYEEAMRIEMLDPKHYDQDARNC